MTIENMKGFWELYEGETNLDKLQEVIELFEEISLLVEETFKVRVAPHTMIRLAQGDLSIEEIKELTINSLKFMIQGTFYNKFYWSKEVRFERVEVFNAKNFCVCKEWLAEKGQVDLISMGRRGKRPNIQEKASKYNLTKEAFELMSNQEKKELFEKFYS